MCSSEVNKNRPAHLNTLDKLQKYSTVVKCKNLKVWVFGQTIHPQVGIVM